MYGKTTHQPGVSGFIISPTVAHRGGTDNIVASAWSYSVADNQTYRRGGFQTTTIHGYYDAWLKSLSVGLQLEILEGMNS